MTVTFGRYELLERISVGGMAEVFKSRVSGAAGFEKIVAIKRILPHLSDDPEFVQMFVDEAKLSADLNHSNIAHVFGFGRVEDRYFIAMEHIHGKDLRRIQDSFREAQKSVPLPIGVRILLDVLNALEYAHSKCDSQGTPQGIVHRDISPQNVLISYEGAVKLIDFGIAKALTRSTQTSTGALKGKVGYMSPEQVDGKDIDHRSDIFAAGTVLWELVTGKPLFLTENELATLARVRQGSVPTPSNVNPSIPKSLDSVILKALAPAPEERFQQAEEFHEALEQFTQLTRMSFSTKQLSRWMKSTFSEEEKVEDEEARTTAFSLASLGGHGSPQERMEASQSQERGRPMPKSNPPPTGDQPAAGPTPPAATAPEKPPAAAASEKPAAAAAPEKPPAAAASEKPAAADAPEKPPAADASEKPPAAAASEKPAAAAAPEKPAAAAAPEKPAAAAAPRAGPPPAPAAPERLAPEPAPESKSRRTVWGIGPSPDERTGGRQSTPRSPFPAAGSSATAPRPMGFGPKVSGKPALPAQPFKHVPASIKSMAGFNQSELSTLAPEPAIDDQQERADAIDVAAQAKLRDQAARLRQIDIPKRPAPASLPALNPKPSEPAKPAAAGKEAREPSRKQVEVVVNSQGKLSLAPTGPASAPDKDPSLAPTLAPGQLFAHGSARAPAAQTLAAKAPAPVAATPSKKPPFPLSPEGLSPLPALVNRQTMIEPAQPEPALGEVDGLDEVDDGPTMIEPLPTLHEMQAASAAPSESPGRSNIISEPTSPTWVPGTQQHPAPERATPPHDGPDGYEAFRPDSPQPYQEEVSTQQSFEALDAEWRRYESDAVQEPLPHQLQEPLPHQLQHPPQYQPGLTPWVPPHQAPAVTETPHPAQPAPWAGGAFSGQEPPPDGDLHLSPPPSGTGFFHKAVLNPTLLPAGAGRRKTILIALAALIVLGVVGGAYALLSGSSQPETAKEDSSADHTLALELKPAAEPHKGPVEKPAPAAEIEPKPWSDDDKPTPEADKPAPAKLAADKPKPTKPAADKTPSKQAADKTPAKQVADKPAPAKPAADKPKPAKPAADKPKPAKPAADKPKPTKPAADKPKPAKPVANKPKPAPAKPKPISQPAKPKPLVTKPVAPRPAAAPAAPRGKPGYLVISSTPWAKIYLDGKDTGRSTPVPPANPLEVGPGRHKVTLAVGSKRFDFPVTVRSGETVRLIRALPVGR